MQCRYLLLVACICAEQSLAEKGGAATASSATVCADDSCSSGEQKTVHTFVADVKRLGSADLSWTEVSQAVGWYAFSTSLVGFGTRTLLLWIVPPYCGEFARWAVLHADWRFIRWTLNMMGIRTFHGDPSRAPAGKIRRRVMNACRMAGDVLIQRPAAGQAFNQGFQFGKRIVENKGVLILTPVVIRQVAVETVQLFVRNCGAGASALRRFIGRPAVKEHNLLITDDNTFDEVAAAAVKDDSLPSIEDDTQDQVPAPSAGISHAQVGAPDNKIEPTCTHLLLVIPASIAAVAFRSFRALV